MPDTISGQAAKISECVDLTLDVNPLALRDAIENVLDEARRMERDAPVFARVYRVYLNALARGLRMTEEPQR